MMIDNSKNGRKAIISIWLFFVVSLIVLVLLTLLFWGYSLIPETWSGDLMDGFYGTLSMELLEPLINSISFGAVAILLSLLLFVFLLSAWFWGRWFLAFLRKIPGNRVSPYLVLFSSFVPAFGVFFHSYFLKDALHRLENELAAYGLSVSKYLPRRFVLWRNAALVLLWVLGITNFNYWLTVLFAEFILLLSIWYYGLLVSTLVKEETKFVNIQSSSGSGQ